MIKSIKYIIFAIGLMWTNYPQTAYSIGVALSFNSIDQLNTIEMESKEIWKDVKGYEGIYQVSNLGSVKSLARFVKNRHSKRLVKEKILSIANRKEKYSTIKLYKNSNGGAFEVHKLVAIAFLNHIPNGFKLVVDHINFNKHDNRIDNLQIITHRENSNLKHILHTSKYTGVFFHKRDKKWVAQISINGKSKYLGNYTNEYEAHLVYEKALKTLIIQEA